MFSHDGIKDSLTRLAAPPLFYDGLRRELSRSARSGEVFSLIRFVLLQEVLGQDELKNEDKSRYEVEILNFADTLTRVCRSEDLLARIGEREFLALVHGNKSVATLLIARVAKGWLAASSINDEKRGGRYPDFQSAHITVRSQEPALGLLNRLDRQPLAYLHR
jgi:GGDEF domain-containing protein